MMVSLEIIIIVVVSLITCLSATNYDRNIGSIAAHHAQSTYCSSNTYHSRNRRQKGILSSFVPTYVINNTVLEHNTEGYIGYDMNYKLIIIAYRGIDQIEHWLNSLDYTMISYPNPSCVDCMVNKAFLTAEKLTIDSVVNEVVRLRDKFKDFTILVTGHGFGE